MNRFSLIAFGAAAALVAGMAAPASAQFYNDKTVTMLVNYPAGGPTDIEARIVARHLADHIPGNPTVIVKNMGGGGGLIASNYLGEIARPDGLTIGFFTWNVLAEALGDPGMRVKYKDLDFIAGIENPLVFYIRKDTPPGIKTRADFAKVHKFKAVSLSPRSTNTVQGALALDMLGVPYLAVPGYKGLKAVEAAVLKNEGQFANTSLPGWLASIEPTFGNEVIALWQADGQNANGTFKHAKALPGVPTFLEFYKMIKGKNAMPSGPRWIAYKTVTDTLTSMFRTVFMRGHSPKAAVKDMQKAFLALWKDESFLKDYERRVKNRPGLVVGAEGRKMIDSLSAMDPATKKFLRAYITKLAS